MNNTIILGQSVIGNPLFHHLLHVKRLKQSLDSLFPIHYDGVTREYKAPCTVWKAAHMKNFEDVLEQYEPMISASIRNLNIYRDHDYFRQTGRVALWQAWSRFDDSKGNFSAYASTSIRGAMLDELKKENRFEEHITQMEDGPLEYEIEVRSVFLNRAIHELAYALDALPSADSDLFKWLFIEGFTLTECAERVGISHAGIKKRRERMLLKLRSELV